MLAPSFHYYKIIVPKCKGKAGPGLQCNTNNIGLYQGELHVRVCSIELHNGLCQVPPSNIFTLTPLAKRDGMDPGVTVFFGQSHANFTSSKQVKSSEEGQFAFLLVEQTS